MIRRGSAGALLLAARLAAVDASAGSAATGAPAGPPVPEPVRQEAYYLYSLAQQALLKRDYRAALEQLERAAACDASPALLLELARLRYSLDDLEGAAALGERIVALGADDVEVRRLLGDVALSQARGRREPGAELERAIGHYRAALRLRPEDAEACRALAEVYYQSGRLEETRALLREFARVRGLDPALLLILGKTELRTGRLAEAEEILADLAARAPGSLEVADALGALYEHQERYDEAIAVYTILLAHGAAGSAYVHDRIGTLHLLAGRAPEAVRHLEEGRRLEPDDPRGLLALGQAYDGAGQTDQAFAAFDRVAALAPDHLEARFHRARMLQRRDGAAAALAAYRDLVEAAGARGPIGEREAIVLTLTYTQIGLLEMAARRYGDAASAFEAALEAAEDPDPELFLLVGRARLEGGETAEARKVLEEASRRHPGSEDLAAFGVEILLSQGRETEARAAWNRLLKEGDRSAESFARVGESLLRRRHHRLAAEVLGEATRRHPGNDALQFAHGAALERLGRAREALVALDRAVRINPNNAMALNYLGYMLADRGERLDESVGFLNRALAIEPGNPAYLDSLGWAQFKLSQYGPAEQNLRAALRADDSDPMIREHLGDLLVKTGRLEEALREWRTALERGHEEPERLRGKMEELRVRLGAAP
ncbi:MAG: tetratricopeptide repeat protein [Candidatus Polarisedimenticolia bacterium]